MAHESFAGGKVARLTGLQLAAVEDRVEADLALGRHAAVVGELEALVAAHPLRERLHGQLMRALYRSGQQAEALEACRRTRRLLGEELGLDPNPELRRLEAAVLAQDAGLDPPADPRWSGRAGGARPPARLRNSGSHPSRPLAVLLGLRVCALSVPRYSA